MDREDFMKKHWKYYFMLETDFLITTRFVELDECNYNTYSVEYAKQYQAICSEIDVICKSICKFIDSSSNPERINEYKDIILRNNNTIITKTIIVSESNNIRLNPFETWQTRHLEWWRNYNSIKHDRLNNYEKANLKNTIDALAGLYLLEMHFLKIICDKYQGVKDYNEPDNPSKLFSIEGWTSNVADKMLSQII